MKILNILVLILILSSLSFNSCSRDRPVLKKDISKCTSRDLLEYGRALFNNEYYVDAITEYRKVIALFPKDKKECSWAQYELAYSFYYMDEFNDALSEFKKVEMLYPNQRGPITLANKMINKITVLLY